MKLEYTFQRYEKKYLLTTAQYEQLLSEITPYMQLDDYGKHTICNLYYDTDTYELIRTSLEKPVYKEKLRLRSYGVASDESPVFLELKKKVEGIVYKRRACVPYAQAEFCLHHHDEKQILKEINWFTQRYTPVPKVMIAYDRMAYYGKKDANLRMTFDFAIRYRDDDLDLRQGDHGTLLLTQDQVLLEVKLRMSMPLWLCEICNRLHIYPVSFSKYGKCYQEHLCEQMLIGGDSYVG